MTADKARKRAVRERMAATGENYTTARTGLQQPGPFWLLVIEHRHGVDHGLYFSEEAARNGCFAYVAEWWDTDGPGHRVGSPAELGPMPEDRDEAISAYFTDADDEFYSIEEVGVVGAPVPKGPEPLDINQLDLSTLGQDELLNLLRRTNDEWRGRSESSFVDVLKKTLAADKDVQSSVEMHGPVVRAVFPTTDYDNGWFFDEYSPTLTYENGTTESVHLELPIGARDLGHEMATVSDAYQPLGSTATYTVNLLSGDTDQDDYGEDLASGPTKVTETTVVHIGSTPGEQYGWECSGCDEISGLQWGTHSNAQTALDRHLDAGCADLIKLHAKEGTK